MDDFISSSNIDNEIKITNNIIEPKNEEIKLITIDDCQDSKWDNSEIDEVQDSKWEDGENFTLTSENITNQPTEIYISPKFDFTTMKNKQIDINKWWNSYLSICRKVETGGLGNDHSDIEGLKYYVEEFSDYMPSNKYNNVLALGCGDGGECKLLVDKGYKVTGITMGIDNIKMAKQLYNLDLIETDMNMLNFPYNTFDAIFSVQSFEHVLSPFITCIELWRILRPGGRVYVDVPDPDDDSMYAGLWHTNLLYARQIKKMFEMCGFMEIKDFSVKHRLRFIFEKLPIEKVEKWNYLRYIHIARDQVYY